MVVELQLDGAALPAVECGDGAADNVGQLRSLDRSAGGRRFVRGAAGAGKFISVKWKAPGGEPLPPPPAQGVAADVAGDEEDPGRELGPRAVALAAAVEAKENVLGQVLGLLPVGHLADEF